ncbi:MAG: BofC C-terminal domain-containing protein [Halanaerobiales bacterium]
MVYTSKRKVLVFLCLFALFISSVTGYYYFRNGKGEDGEISRNRTDLQVNKFPGFLEQSLQELEKEAAAKKQEGSGRLLGFWNRVSGEMITESTPLIIQAVYEDSVLEEAVEMPEAFVGLDVDELASLAGEWNVDSYNESDGLVLRRSLDKLPQEYREYQYLGIYNGHVAIFYGRQGTEFLKQETGIKIDDLPIDEERKLKDGIEVSSEEELLTVLESLLSYTQD